MILQLTRTHFGPHSTLGRLEEWHVTNDPYFQCYTLEDRVHDGPKIPGETAIGEGSFDVIINYSERFKRRMPLICNVPNFTGIRFHWGGTAKDTRGCILVGNSWGAGLGEDYAIFNSLAAFNTLFTLLDDALTRGEPCRLTVTHEISVVTTSEAWGGK